MRFTIRDLLWLTLLAAVLVAWWVDHWRQAQTVEKIRKQLDWLPPSGSVRAGFRLDAF